MEVNQEFEYQFDRFKDFVHHWELILDFDEFQLATFMFHINSFAERQKTAPLPEIIEYMTITKVTYNDEIKNYCIDLTYKVLDFDDLQPLRIYIRY